MLQGFRKYKEHTFQRISAEGAEGEELKEGDEELKPLKEFMAETLKEYVEKGVFTTRSSTVPAILLTTKYASSGAMENIIKSHPGAENNPMTMMMMSSKKILEVCAEHGMVKAISDHLAEGRKEEASAQVKFMYDAALVGCGFPLDDKSTFVKNMYSMMSAASKTAKK
jgi:HSP90 family molecular chaperone